MEDFGEYTELMCLECGELMETPPDDDVCPFCSGFQTVYPVD